MNHSAKFYKMLAKCSQNMCRIGKKDKKDWRHTTDKFNQQNKILVK